MELDNKFIQAHIQNAQNGKVVSLEELFELNINYIYAIILRMTNSKSLAGMIAFNVLIKAWKKIKDFPDDITFKDWIRNITIETTYDELKNKKLVRDKKLQKQIQSESGVEEFQDVPLEKAISDLNYESRTTIVLNRIEQLSFDEITELTGISEGDAKEYVVSGIGEISRIFSESEPDPGTITEIEDLPKEIEPDRDIIPFTIDKIRETKEEEFKEEDIEFEEIEKLPKQKIKFKKEKAEKLKFRLNKKFLTVSCVLIVAIAIIYYLTLTSYEWTVSTISGTTLLNSRPIAGKTIVSGDDFLTTDLSSTAELRIETLAKIEIEPDSKLQRLGSDNRAKLLVGKLNVSTTSENDYLFLEVPSAVVEEYYLNNDYVVSIDDIGNTELEVTSGWLQVVDENVIAVVPEGYKIRVLKGIGIGVPVSYRSFTSLSPLLEEYLFAGRNIVVLSSILDMAAPSEAITLWNLLYRVTPAQRDMVYGKLNTLVPRPINISKDDIMKLNEEMLQLWLEEIEWMM
ncbi:MAG: RNA polymerase sigma factor [Ignavibacteria bacterium]|jgi:RNA polymerase sigma-70 factor (ECF subfamily)